MFETALLSGDENHKTIPLNLKTASDAGNFLAGRAVKRKAHARHCPRLPPPVLTGRAGVRGFEPETIAPPHPNPVALIFHRGFALSYLGGEEGENGGGAQMRHSGTHAANFRLLPSLDFCKINPMRHTRIGNGLLTFGSLLLCLCPFSCSVATKSPATWPPPVSYQHIVRRDPNFSIHVRKKIGK